MIGLSPPKVTRPSTGSAARVATAAFVLSYAGQRLFALGSEPALGADVVATLHIPFFWRTALAALHAGVLWLVARRVELDGPWVLPAVIGGAALLVVVP